MFCSYALIEKQSYCESIKKELDKDDLLNPIGQVTLVEKAGKTGVIILTGDIDYINSIKIIEALKSMEKKYREIDFYLYTTGGVLYAAMAITDAIQQLKIKVNTYAVGYCFSGGTYILAAGTGIRYASKHAPIGLHFTSKDADAPEGSHHYVMNSNVARFWKKQSKLPESIDTSIPGSYDLSPDKAKEWGIVDVVY
jgi:ATP-dependent Clp protease protease subunit